MARSLTFKLNGEDFPAEPVKVDRSKLYGWTALKALDDSGRECLMVSMDEAGTFIIPQGGIGMGIISPEREWVERSSLKAVNPDGSDAAPVPSSYSAPIALETIVDTETFLDHKITSVYQLGASPEFLSAVGETIYAFTYSFRDSFKGDSAFVLASGGALFMLVGQKQEFEMLGLANAGAIDEANSEDEEEESDDLDFGAF
jgi:hypothetical protein